MNDKPIIRHCQNCKWCTDAAFYDGYCNVKYKYIQNARKSALLCRYFKPKGSEEDEID